VLRLCLDPATYPHFVTRFADARSMWTRRARLLLAVGLLLLLLGSLMQACLGDTAGWTASTDLSLATAEDAEAAGGPRNVLLTLDHEAQLARHELGGDYVVGVDQDAATLSISVDADSEAAAIRSIGRAIELTSRDDRIAQRVVRRLASLDQELNAVEAEYDALAAGLGDDAAISLGPLPLYVPDPETTWRNRSSADPDFSPLRLVADVLRLQNLESRQDDLEAEQRQLAAGPVSGPVTASTLSVVPFPRRGFGWRDAIKVMGTAIAAISAISLLLSLTEGKTRRRIALGLALATTTWAILIASTVLQIRSNVRSATVTLRQVETMVSSPDAGDADLAAIERNLTTANTKIQRANDNASAVWMRLLYAIPGLDLLQQSSRQTLRTAADGVALTIELTTHAQTAQRSLNGNPTGRARVVADFRDQVVQTTEKIEALTLPPRQWLPGRVHARYDQLQVALDRAQQSAADLQLGLDVAAHFLGSDGEWLLIGGSTADARMSMGAFLAAGVLTVDGGDLRSDALTDMNSELALGAEESREIDVDIERNFGAISGNQRWPTIGYSPRFAPAARSAATLWKEQSGQDVRGVIYVDSVAIAELAGAVAPILHAGRTYDGPQVGTELLRGQYESNRNGASATDLGTQLAEEVLSKVLATEDPLAVARVLVSAARNRHVMVWSDAPELRERMAALEIDGAIDTSALGVSLASMSGKWADWTNLAVDVSSSCSEEQGLRLDLEVTVDLEEVPADLTAISRAQTWNEPLERFVGLVAVTLPGSAATDVAGLGAFALGEGKDGANRLATAFVGLDPGEQATMTLQVLLPPTVEIPLLASGRSNAITWSHNGEKVAYRQPLLVCPALRPGDP